MVWGAEVLAFSTEFPSFFSFFGLPLVSGAFQQRTTAEHTLRRRTFSGDTPFSQNTHFKRRTLFRGTHFYGGTHFSSAQALWRFTHSDWALFLHTFRRHGLLLLGACSTAAHTVRRRTFATHSAADGFWRHTNTFTAGHLSLRRKHFRGSHIPAAHVFWRITHCGVSHTPTPFFLAQSSRQSFAAFDLLSFRWRGTFTGVDSPFPQFSKRGVFDGALASVSEFFTGSF